MPVYYFTLFFPGLLLRQVPGVRRGGGPYQERSLRVARRQHAQSQNTKQTNGCPGIYPTHKRSTTISLSAPSLSPVLCHSTQICGKALEPDEEELEAQRQHFTGAQAEGKMPLQSGAGEQQPQTTTTQQQQPQRGKEGKEAELSGGENLGERREGGQQTEVSTLR